MRDLASDIVKRVIRKKTGKTHVNSSVIRLRLGTGDLNDRSRGRDLKDYDEKREDKKKRIFWGETERSRNRSAKVKRGKAW